MNVTDKSDRNGTEPRAAEPAEATGLDGKLTRLTGHARGLMEELTVWVDLKIQHAITGVQQDLESKGKRVALDVGAGVIALVGVLFALVALALGIGAWLGPAWGFMIVSGLLFLGAFVMYAVNHRKRAGRSIPVEGRRVPPSLKPGTIPELERHED